MVAVAAADTFAAVGTTVVVAGSTAFLDCSQVVVVAG